MNEEQLPENLSRGLIITFLGTAFIMLIIFIHTQTTQLEMLKEIKELKELIKTK